MQRNRMTMPVRAHVETDADYNAAARADEHRKISLPLFSTFSGFKTPPALARSK
jgi:hypothetical protein